MAYQDKLWNCYKSEGEKRIGTYLHERGIEFTYEKPVAVVDNGKTKIWYPDFCLDNYHILIEYLGMNGNQQNTKINDYKRKVYHENRLDLIEIYSSDFKRNWQQKIDVGIKGTLEGRVRDYLSKPRYHFPSRDLVKGYGQIGFKFHP